MQSPNCSLFKISYSVRSTKLYIIATPQSLQCTLVLILTQSLSQPCMFAHRCTALQCTTATWLLSAHYDKTLNVRDPRVDIKKTALSIATEHNATITHMACSPNGDVVATLARDHSMRLHDVRTLTHMRVGRGVGSAHAAVSLSARFCVPTWLVEAPVTCERAYTPQGRLRMCGSVCVWLTMQSVSCLCVPLASLLSFISTNLFSESSVC
eukprot:m.671782 g.671782  ORF g.671782 m.671782 type:complete len:210 (+) comp22776_c1_seq7:1664-2293(+)